MVEWWARRYSANAAAFHELKYLDLGPELGDWGTRGEIVFVDWAYPGNDYLGVTATDVASLSLLQARLTELNTGILVKTSTWAAKA